jgi:hypothetical protein
MCVAGGKGIEKLKDGIKGQKKLGRLGAYSYSSPHLSGKDDGTISYLDCRLDLY